MLPSGRSRPTGLRQFLHLRISVLRILRRASAFAIDRVRSTMSQTGVCVSQQEQEKNFARSPLIGRPSTTSA